MEKGKLLKYIGLILMIGSLAYMTISYIQGQSMTPIIIGLLGVSAGNILHYFGNKSIAEKEHV